MITALTSLRRILRLPAVLMVFLAATAATFSQSQDPVLRTIIEKTRQREALLDSFDWRLAQVRAHDAPEEGSEIRWVKSGAKYLYVLEDRDIEGTELVTDVLTAASDGSYVRSLRSFGKDLNKGSIEKASGTYPYHDVVNGIGMRIEEGPGSLDEWLEGDIAKLRAKYGDAMGPLENSDLKVSYAGRQAVGDHQCEAVDLYLSQPESDRVEVRRYYFAADLNYTCAQIENGTYLDDGFSASGRVELRDFREVKPGVFVPFTLKSVHGLGQTYSFTFEWQTRTFEELTSADQSLFTLDFPAGTRVYDAVLDMQYIVGEGPQKEDIEETVAALGTRGDGASTDSAVGDAAKAVAAATDVPPTEAEADGSFHIDSGRGQGFVPVGLALVVLVILAAAFALAAALRRRGRNA